MSVKTDDQTYIAGTYARFPIQIVSGKGALLYDDEGKEYIDMGSGIGVNIFGECDEGWEQAVIAQLHSFQHTSNLYYSEPCVKLAKLLCEKTGMKKVFFSNSGAEANECAIKTARKYAAEKKGKGCFRIITLKNSFHGRTITTLAATGQESFHNDFLPLTEGFVYAAANDLDEVKRLASEAPIAAIMFEAIQGEGGVNPLEPSFLKGLAEFADEKDILLIADEVQCGNGRSGKMYAYMNYGIHPDLVTTAKGLGGGLPIGATLFGEKTAEVLGLGSHGSTFGGNPVVTAGAYYIVSKLTDDFLAEVQEKSELLIRELSGKTGIKSIAGMGLMLGIETEKDVNEVLLFCRQNGVLPLKAKNKLRLLPPLTITKEQLIKAAAVIRAACE